MYAALCDIPRSNDDDARGRGNKAKHIRSTGENERQLQKKAFLVEEEREAEQGALPLLGRAK